MVNNWLTFDYHGSLNVFIEQEKRAIGKFLFVEQRRKKLIKQEPMRRLPFAAPAYARRIEGLVQRWNG